MVFSSTFFIFIFLPAFLLVYYTLPNRLKNIFIILGGYFFYSWGAPNYALILLFTIIMDYFFSHLISKNNQIGRKKYSKILLIISIIVNIGLLGYFKYSNFFLDQVNYILPLLNIGPMPWREVVLPIGISFLVFQELSYIIDVYRGKTKPAKSIVDFAAYMLLFPQIIAGPIVRYVDIAKQLRDRVCSTSMFFEGIRRFSIGLAKKILVANSMSTIADSVFQLHQSGDISSPIAWLGIIAYGMQIYFDFSGYSDMAIGLAKMLGFNFLENFNMPYIATSVTDFWRRWHISLSTWMREYLYIPLGGNRVSTIRMYMNLWIVFLISGLWHGANWNFIVWGAFHGFFLVLDKLFLLKLTKKIPEKINIFFTFIIIMVSWSFFRIENLYSAWNLITKMFNLTTWFGPIVTRWTEVMDHRSAVTLLIALFLCFFPITKTYKKIIAYYNSLSLNKIILTKAVYTISLFVLSLLSLVNAFFNPFIYFRF